MNGKLLAVGAWIVAGVFSSAVAQTPPARPPQPILIDAATAKIATAFVMAEKVRASGSTQAAYPELLKLVDDPQLLTAPVELRRQVRTSFARAASQTGHAKEATRQLVLMTAEPSATPDDWRLRVNISIDDWEADDALAAVLAFPKANLAAYNLALNSGLIRQLYAELGASPGAAAKRLTLMNALLASNWRSTSDVPDVWTSHAGALITAGEFEQATEALRRVSRPRVVASVRADKRFDQVVNAVPARFDVQTWVSNEIEFRRQAAALAPNSMLAYCDHLRVLVDYGRYQEALDQADRVLAVVAAPGGLASFRDANTGISGVRAMRAKALLGLGRFSDAATELAAMGEPGKTPPYVFIRPLAQSGVYLQLGRWREAVDAALLATDDKASFLSSQAVNQPVLACAYFKLGDKENSDRAMAVLRLRARENPAALQLGLLCTENGAEAAQLLIRRLKDPADRLTALLEVQRYSPSGGAPFDVWLTAQRRLINSRADVAAVIQSVGRIQTLPIPMPGLDPS